jgi:biopolymer transport protein ExbB
MIWIAQGGIMTWPLLALSVVVLAILIDRGIAFSTLRLPDTAQEAAILEALRKGDKEAARALTESSAPALQPLIEALCADESAAVRECDAAIRVEEVVRSLDRHLGVLALASRVAPLMGLLGTILGIILTFSHLSSTQGAVDMSSLAEGIWQALIATAIGLFIAIPAVFAHHAFLQREEFVAFSLARLANRALARTITEPTL